MTNRLSIRRAKRPSEEGYVLLGVIILLALFVIAMAVAAPKVAKQIQRDHDLETMRRGRQYIRAIKLYYKKFNAYPPNVDALVKTQEIRFLRKRYIDPITGKDDWKPIYVGQNKTPMAMGFFGQPLGGTGGNVIAGTGPGGVGSTIGTQIGSSSTVQPQTTSNQPQTIGNSNAGNTGTGNSGSGTGTSGSGDASSSSSGFGDSGMTVGGAMIGVSPASSKQSIFVYKTKNHYNEWEFLYSPLSDMPGMAGGTTGLPTTGTNGNGTQTNIGIGNSNNGNGGSNTNTNTNNNGGTGSGNNGSNGSGSQPPQ
ncbi:type II secretion system protein [Terracidiphilus gabretensis]|jgi:type II secretory pathway pseudopilin PulG|uniref:type II secretion system protein n=1 Tax=Terracidiphilus gabretensis TaxID=1577687 RepID=UPI00071BFE36|nr:type II secretion system protein [Terracidiphilus gabretensis]